MTVTRRTRLAALGVAAASIALAVGLLYAAWLQATVAVRTDELARQVYAMAEGMPAGGAVDFSAESPLTGLRQQLFEVEAGLIGARLVLTDADGNVVQSSSTGGTIETYDLEGLTGEPDDRGLRTGVRSLSGIGRVILVVAPVQGSPEDGYLLGIQPLTELASLQRTGALVVLGVAFVSLIVAWLVGGMVARRTTAPLVRLRGGAEAITAGAWGHQVPVDGDEEVAALAESFNAMSSRVEAAYNAQRSFVGDVSHELRTPITSIQGFAGALLDGMAATEDQRERYLRIIKQESARLMELTGTMLELADLDSGRVAIAREPVDTTALAEALHARHYGPASDGAITLEIGDLGAEARPLADEWRVLQVASALVGNALAYTPKGGHVRVSAELAEGQWELRVCDSGPGVPVAERERIFERFARLDESRTSSSGGFGLGLAICQRLVEAMGGAIRVQGSELGGACFVVALEATGVSDAS
ncbi:MAG: HAMP domain-containing sensor histidine kinase [Coriobacteriia bacterium]|nr:HAMP domain-containing sensor histidine kinase [Coriobacteriia bacterium]